MTWFSGHLQLCLTCRFLNTTPLSCNPSRIQVLVNINFLKWSLLMEVAGCKELPNSNLPFVQVLIHFWANLVAVGRKHLFIFWLACLVYLSFSRSCQGGPLITGMLECISVWWEQSLALFSLLWGLRSYAPTWHLDETCLQPVPGR